MSRSVILILLFLNSFISSAQNNCEIEWPSEPVHTGVNTTYIVNGLQIFENDDNLSFPKLGSFFTNNDGELQCAGWVVVGEGGIQIQIPVWGNDETTDELDGFINGEEIIIMATFDGITTYQTSTGQFILGNGIYETNGINVLSELTILNAIYCVNDADENPGCTDSDYIEYNPNASTDDGSCLTLIVEGCFNPDYLEYDPLANTDDNSCNELKISGCMDPLFVQYNPLVNSDNGSCEVLIRDALSELIGGYQNLYNFSDSIISELELNTESWNNSITLQEGWNMFGYGCPIQIDLVQGLSNHTDLIDIVKENNGAVYIPEYNFNGIGNLIPGYGYQINVVETIEVFRLCDWYIDNMNDYNINNIDLDLISIQSDLGCYENPENCINELGVLGCMESEACNYNPEANIAYGSCAYPQIGYDCDGNITAEIGDVMEGGYLFYVDSTGQRGLVSALEDLYGLHEWGCYGTDINGNNSSLNPELQSIGAGLQNTLEIVSGCSETPIAASEALAYESADGYSDWYLPSFDELYKMYITIGQGSSEGNIGGFINSFYWSSSEYSSGFASLVVFPSGATHNYNKGIPVRVRPIRAFGNWTIGCMDENACNYNPEANMADGSCEYAQEGYDCDGNIVPQYQVGDLAEGGIVFYVDSTGQQGLIAALQHLGQHQWGCSGTDISGADGTFIGAGYQNTLDIVAGCSEAPIAASLALAFESEGYDDWYLPSFDELVEMYNTIEEALAFELEGYEDWSEYEFWSSSELSDISAWGWDSDFDASDSGSKFYLYKVHPIRAFGNWTMGCMDSLACNFNPEANMADGSCEYAEEGYDCDGNIIEELLDIIYAEGGIVFYLDETGTRGLVAAWEDLPGTYEWGCFEEDVNGADGTSIGTGYQNTMDIANNGCMTENEGITAAQAALDAEINGYSDWYLPSKYELEEMYNTIGIPIAIGTGMLGSVNIGGFETSNLNYYWSSSENSSDFAWSVNFNLGILEDAYYKNTIARVRPIRFFGNWTMGCMDSLACNYNNEANMADGSCTFPNLGGNCSPSACPYDVFLEYSPYSNSYDYSACITPVVMGCMDSIAENFNTEANVEDGSCEYILGCMDNGADNFNQEATQEDNSCIYYGCIDSLANNYDLIANQDDGSCIFYGCTDPEAINYYENANTDNGFCDYLGCMDESADNFDANATLFSNDCIYSGCIEPEADNYDSNANQNDGSCIYLGCTNEMAENYNQEANQDDDSCIIMGCTFDIFPNYNSEATEEDGSCDMSSLVVFGCTDPSYVEFNIYANQNNGTCSVFVVYGCTGADHCNYNPDANTDDGSCIYTQEGYDCDGNITEYIVGMEEEGGIVFYIDETGDHGLVAAMEDLPGTYQWGCYGTSISGADGQTIGTGLQNTLDIVSGCSETPIAASVALAYESGGYSDWYLPSFDELKEMFNTIGNGGLEGNIGGFSSNWYWSSSESGGNDAWVVYFNNGAAYASYKNYTYRVRVIRAF